MRPSAHSIRRPLAAVVHAAALAIVATAALPGRSAAQSIVAGDPPHPAADPSPRTAEGRREVLALAAHVRPVIDGALDDAVWRAGAPAGGFVQSEPQQGAPASEPTDVWVAYDATQLYVAAYLHDREPGGIVVNDVRKDFREDDQDTFEVLLDTFGDRRNGYVFITNVAGAKADRQVANEGREVNASWDAVWSVRTRRVADGWTVEMAIPFRALRFDPSGAHPWGINFSRRLRRRNEVDFWSPVPRAYNLTRVSLAGELAGLAAPSGTRDLRVKPYVAERTVRELRAGAAFSEQHDVGADLKYGLTPGLTLDVTANPDFAQAEADEQQVNLTQFSQFFPEKREFFLENSGIFYVGDAARNNRVFATPTPDEDLLLFFSRRIGLTSDGRAIPIAGGARVTGSAGAMRVGALSMATRGAPGAPATAYTVLRARRNLFTGSDVGVIAMSRDVTDWSALAGDTLARARLAPSNRVLGVDGNVRFAGKVDWNSYAVRTATPGAPAGQYAARTSLSYEGNFLHLKGGVLQIGDGFRDDFGFYRRVGDRKWLFDAGIRPRLARLRRIGIREMHPHVTWNYYEDLHGRVIGKDLHTGYSFFLSSGAFAELSANPAFQRIATPFRIDRAVGAIPAGGYAWTTWQLKGQTDPSKPLNLSYTLIEGGLWTGTQHTQNLVLTARPTYRLRVASGVQRTDATLARGATDAIDPRFIATLWTLRGSYSFTTSMFVDGLSQYDPRQHARNTNVRFNLIHHPLSDLFVVLNEQRTATPEHIPPGRSLIVKFTQMLSL